MLENLKRIALPLTIGAIIGCQGNREISDQQTATGEALKCIVLCESGEPEKEEYSVAYQCHPDIPETGREQAKREAYEIWRQLPKQAKQECPSPRTFDLITQ